MPEEIEQDYDLTDFLIETGVQTRSNYDEEGTDRS